MSKVEESTGCIEVSDDDFLSILLFDFLCAIDAFVSYVSSLLQFLSLSSTFLP